MRTYAMGVADVQNKIAENGNPVSFTYGVATDQAPSLRGVYTFASGKVLSFVVPNTDIEFMKGIGDTVGKLTGANSTPLGQGMNNVMGSLGLKGAPIMEQVRTIGIMPVLIGLTILVVVFRWLYKKMKRKRRR